MVLATWKEVPLGTAAVTELLGEETKAEDVSILVSEDHMPWGIPQCYLKRYGDVTQSCGMWSLIWLLI